MKLEDLKKQLDANTKKINDNIKRIDSNAEKILENIEKIQNNSNKIEGNAKKIEQNSFALEILSDYKKSIQRLYTILILMIIVWIVTLISFHI